MTRQSRKWAKALICILCFHATHAQQARSFITTGAFIDIQYPRFSEASIKAEQIERITLRKMRKPSGSPIYDDGERVHYQFDSAGRLISFQLIFRGFRGKMDTTTRRFTYTKNLLISMEVQRGKYRKRTDYSFPNDSTVIEERWVRRGNNIWEFLDKEQALHTKRNTANGWEETTWIGGEHAKPYKSIVQSYDHNGRLYKKEIWHGARISLSEKWTYQNNMLAHYERQNKSEAESLSITYPPAPDQDGKWCENDQCRNWNMVNHEDGKPKAWIFFQASTQNMELFEFRYH